MSLKDKLEIGLKPDAPYRPDNLPEEPAERTMASPELDLLSGSSLIGLEVVNAEGDALGTVDDIVVDVAAGRIGYIVLAAGGFLGFGNALLVVPWAALRLDAGHRRLVIGESRERLEKAPRLDKDRWMDLRDHRFGQQVHDYYRVPVYWR